MLILHSLQTSFQFLRNSLPQNRCSESAFVEFVVFCLPEEEEVRLLVVCDNSITTFPSFTLASFDLAIAPGHSPLQFAEDYFHPI